MEGRARPGESPLHRPARSSATVVRRLRGGAVGLLALLAWAVAAPSFLPSGALAAGGGRQPEAALVAAVGGEPDPAEWARLRYLAWLRGREAAAAAEAERAAAIRAAGGAGATATPAARVVPAGGNRAIPALSLRAYREAAAWATGFDPACRLSWAVLAGIGRIESNHGLHGGAATRFSAGGTVSPRITGPPLDGRGVASIPDSDGGRWDGDRTWDRAVGPMQFIPTTWRSLGRDGSGDRVADPNNLFDAAVSAAAYLCLSVDGDLRDPARLGRAIHNYNHSWPYVEAVLGWARLYQGGIAVGPGVPGGPAASTITTGAPAAAPTTRATTTTRRPTTSEPPTSRSTTTRPPTTASTTSTLPPTTLPPTTRPSTTGSTTSTTEPCQTTTSTTEGGSTTTTSSTTSTTAPGGSTTTTTTLPPCS
jgi:transglycosylase-like protein with SLT domain